MYFIDSFNVSIFFPLKRDRFIIGRKGGQREMSLSLSPGVTAHPCVTPGAMVVHILLNYNFNNNDNVKLYAYSILYRP